MKSFEQLRADLESDEDLRNKILSCEGEDAVNAAFAEAGYDVTFAEVIEYIKKETAGLSDEELAKVAGGFWVKNPGVSTNVPSGIACCIVGAGATCWMEFGDR